MEKGNLRAVARLSALHGGIVRSMVSIVALLAAICVLAGGLDRAAANSVRAYQADVAHDGNVTLKNGFGSRLKKKWVRDLGGPVSYPLFAKGLVFVTVGNPSGTGSQIVALDPHTGDTIWSMQIPDTYSNRSHAAYDNGRIFVVDALGMVRAISAGRSGKLLWKTQLSGQTFFMDPPTADNGQMVVSGAGFGGTLYSLSETNGALSWTAPVENGDEGAPAFGGGGVYVTYPCQYYKFDPANGNLIWNYDDGCEGGGGGTPVYHRDRLYVRWPINALDSIIDTVSGSKVGTFAVAVPAPAIFQGPNQHDYLVEVDYFGNLLCSDLQTGERVWSFSGDGYLDSAPLVVNGKVVEGSGFGNLYLIDGANGTVLWSGDVGASIAPPDEQNDNGPLTGFGVAGNTLLVPATNLLVAYVSKK